MRLPEWPGEDYLYVTCGRRLWRHADCSDDDYHPTILDLTTQKWYLIDLHCETLPDGETNDDYSDPRNDTRNASRDGGTTRPPDAS